MPHLLGWMMSEQDRRDREFGAMVRQQLATSNHSYGEKRFAERQFQRETRIILDGMRIAFDWCYPRGKHLSHTLVWCIRCYLDEGVRRAGAVDGLPADEQAIYREFAREHGNA